MGDASDLPDEVPFESEDLPDELLHETREELVADRLRGSGVGTEDPNIVGDVGPTDIPPGADPDSGLIVTPEPDEDDS
jgi:hypothetical protein